MNDSGYLNKVSSVILPGLKGEFTKELEELLDFWSTRCIDDTNGGFIGKMDHDGQIDPKAGKGCILNTRILWTFSAACMLSAKESYRSAANRAYDYLKNYFWDEQHGGLYWELDHTGAPLNTKKQAYVQGFGVYAFSEYYRATGKKESLDYAMALFELLEDKFWEPKNGGYIEALNRNWQDLDDVRLSAKDLNLPKSMNTHLHILEPYTNLYRVWPEPKLKSAITSLLHIFCRKFFNRETNHLDLFFSLDWKSQFHEISFGHDIEAAWLMNEASMVIDQGVLNEEVQEVTGLLTEATRKEGLDKDGSLFYEKHLRHLDKDKHWWPQAEAMVGFMDAYEIYQKTEYLEEVQRLWGFIKEYMKDQKNGEWYWRVDKDNKPVPVEDKVGFWKCPYHNSRALMELIKRIDKLNR